MTERDSPSPSGSENNDADESSRKRISANLKAYWDGARINLAKRTIRKGLKSAPDEIGDPTPRFRTVIEKQPARLSEILECLDSDRRFERTLGSLMFRAWIVDPADVLLHRHTLANAIRAEARRIEGRSAKRASARKPSEATLLQAGARLSPRHTSFYTDYYFAFGEASVEKAVTKRKLTTALHKRAGWLPEALAMLTGMHRMHDVARDAGLQWSPSLLKGYTFAGGCLWKPRLTIFGSALAIREKARGKKTIEDNLRGKSIAACIWYSGLDHSAEDGRPLSEIIGDIAIDLSAYETDLGALLQRAAYIWDEVVTPEYRDRCGPSEIAFPPKAFDAAVLEDSDEQRIHTLLSVKSGRPRSR